MSNKTKRSGKKYQPRPIKYSAINAVLVAQHPLDATQQSELIDGTRAALNRIRFDPKPLKDDLMTIKVALEVAAQIADRQSTGGESALDVIEDGLRCVLVCKARGALTGSIRFTGDELQLIEPALDLHDAIIQLATCGQIRAATKFLKTMEYQPSFELAKRVA